MKRDLYKSIGIRIRAARERLDLSQEQLAQRMGYTSPATISHFESGTRRISVADLHRLAEELGVPLEYFIVATDDEPQLRHFRLRAEAVRPVVREAVAQFLSFAAKNGAEPVQLPRTVTTMGAGAAAECILKETHIDAPPVSPFAVAKQFAVPVFQWDFPDEVSGIFVLHDRKACIGVNQNHPYVRQRFSVAHELGHFVFHEAKDLFVDFTDIDMAMTAMDESERSREMIANWFAADLLMPRRWIREDFDRYGEDNLLLMAQRYDVSEHALWFRLLNLKLVGQTGNQA